MANQETASSRSGHRRGTQRIVHSLQVQEGVRETGRSKLLLRHMLSLLFWPLRVRPSEPSKSKCIQGQGINVPLSCLLDAARSFPLSPVRLANLRLARRSEQHKPAPPGLFQRDNQNNKDKIRADGTEPPPPPVPWPSGTTSVPSYKADGTEPPPPPLPWGQAVTEGKFQKVQIADGTEPPPPPLPWPKSTVGIAA